MVPSLQQTDLIDVLIKRCLLPDTMSITTITSLPERENTKKEINPKYNFVTHIRNILLCIRLLRDLINSQDKYQHMLEKYGGIDTLIHY